MRAPPIDGAVAPGETATLSVTRLEPAAGRRRLDLAEAWRSRHLVRMLVRRDLRIRYRQTALGAAWVILQPLTTMLFFVLFFGRLGRLPSDGLPYPIFYYSGLLPWLYFAHAVTTATASLNDHARIIGRVYFPRVVLPLAPIISGLMDLGVAGSLLGLLMLWYGIPPSTAAPAALAFVALAVASATGVSLWLSALSARYKDVRYALGFALQLGLFASPVVYPMTLVPEAWRPVYALNPMAVAVQGFRWSLTGEGFPGHVAVLISFSVVVLLVTGGLAFFRWAEADLADVI